MFTSKNRVLCFFLLFLTLFNLFSLISSQEDDYQYRLCSEKNGYYLRNGTYEKNLDKILLSLAPNTNQSGYYAASVGNSSDKVNAMALCRGDVTDTETCRGCIARVANRLKNECYAIKEALGGSNRCLLFYTNNSLSGIVGTPTDYMINPYQNVFNVDRFNTGLMTLLNDLRGKAASGGNLQKYASGKYLMESYLTVYAFVQCTPVLSAKQCNNCLVGAIGGIYGCCNNRAGGRVVKPSCNLRYEISPFVKMDQNTPVSSPPGSLPVSPGTKNKSTGTIVIVVVSTVSSLIAIVIFTITISKMKKRKQTSVLQRLQFEEVSTTDDLSFEKSLQYDFATISIATDNFSDTNKLGQGGFGSVYKGILPNGQEIAVKRLSLGSGQGESEFKNEVSLVAKLQQSGY